MWPLCTGGLRIQVVSVTRWSPYPGGLRIQVVSVSRAIPLEMPLIGASCSGPLGQVVALSEQSP